MIQPFRQPTKLSHPNFQKIVLSSEENFQEFERAGCVTIAK